MSVFGAEAQSSLSNASRRQPGLCEIRRQPNGSFNLNTEQLEACYRHLRSQVRNPTAGSMEARAAQYTNLSDFAQPSAMACGRVQDFMLEVFQASRSTLVHQDAINGIIRAEMTLYDHIDAFSERFWIEDTNPSLGVTQIKLQTFCSIFNASAPGDNLARLDCNTPEGRRMAFEMLTATREWPIFATAFLLRHIAEHYNPLIPNADTYLNPQIGVYATVYNLGNPEGRSQRLIERRAREGHEHVYPSLNLYGVFVEASQNRCP